MRRVVTGIQPSGTPHLGNYRGHAYKSLVDENQQAGRPADAGVTAGVFNYPLLMAADILIHGADVVPVGDDNRQHIEITRDVAAAFNANYGPVFTVPEGRIEPSVGTVPGTDGRKMSASTDNVIPIFAGRDELTRRIMAIVTDSRRPDEPKSPESCNVYSLYRLVAAPHDAAELAGRYRSGSVTYREAKERLIDTHERRFGGARERFAELSADRTYLRAVLASGAERARAVVTDRLSRARDAVGIISAP